jgi:copper chaperone CopZ
MMNLNQTINVTGMTCQNCVRHVRDALTALPGVRSVDVDVTAGRVEISADRPLPREELRAALDEAGYALT